MIFILFLLAIITVGYLYFYTKKVLDFINRNKENKREELVYEDFFKFKAFSYTLYILPLIISILISRYITLDAWLVVYYCIWALGFIYISLNIKMLNHVLDVIFVKDALNKVEREFLIGCVKKRRGVGYVFKYRLLGATIKI